MWRLIEILVFISACWIFFGAGMRYERMRRRNNLMREIDLVERMYDDV